MNQRLQSDLEIRPIEERDNPSIANVIRTVMTEFGAVGEGYSIQDAEVDDIYGNYHDDRHCYFVVTDSDQVLGGGGFGLLKGGNQNTCELRKMFFMPELRGRGMGKRLLMLILSEAKSRGFKTCYLETLERMEQANWLYQSCGFKPLDGAMGKTGHCSCDRYYAREL